VILKREINLTKMRRLLDEIQEEFQKTTPYQTSTNLVPSSDDDDK
jgi:hypothetical protein